MLTSKRVATATEHELRGAADKQIYKNKVNESKLEQQ
jgi:hypothetical protein